LLIIYEATIAIYSVSRAGLLSHAKPIQVRLSGDSTQILIGYYSTSLLKGCCNIACVESYGISVFMKL